MAIAQLLAHLHLAHQFVTRVGALVKVQHLSAVKRAGAGQLGAQHGGNQRCHEHAGRHAFGFPVAVQIAVGQVHGVVVAR